MSTLYYAWLAYRLAKKTGRSDVCALPSGISVPHMFVVTFVIMLPIALKTGNPAAVNSSFLLFFPFLFLTSSYVPRDQLSGWLDTVAGWNPVTYLLEGLRSLALSGWHWDDIGKAFLALLVVFLISFGLCFAALRSRVNQR